MKVVLPSNGLTCSEIPPSIQNLYLLASLDLSDNEIQAVIPDAIQYLRSLQHLDWSHNAIFGALSSELGSLFDFSLTYLDLSYNQLTGSIPSYFEDATLTYADLSNNLFVCPIPSWASYTQATCVNWTISALDNRCVFSGGKYVVFGKNFASQSGMDCVLVNRTSGEEASRSPAVIISDTELLCQSRYYPTSCSVQAGERLLEYFKLNLAIGDALILSNPPDVGIVNMRCYAEDSNQYVPTDIVALRLCEVANTSTLWSAPSTFTLSQSQFFPLSSLSPNCTEDDCSPFPSATQRNVYVQGNNQGTKYNETGWGQNMLSYWVCYSHSCTPASTACYGSFSPSYLNTISYYYYPNSYCAQTGIFYRSQTACQANCF